MADAYAELKVDGDFESANLIETGVARFVDWYLGYYRADPSAWMDQLGTSFPDGNIRTV